MTLVSISLNSDIKNSRIKLLRKKRKPTILILADGMPAGGTERQIVELLKGLKQNSNFFVVFGVLVKGGAFEEEAIFWADLFVPLPQHLSYDITLAFSVYKAVKKYNIQLIHTFGMISDWAGLYAAKANRIPYISGSIRSARPILNHRDIISRIAMQFADKIVSNSSAGLSAFKIMKHPRIEVIKNGVDLNRFENLNLDTEANWTLCMVGNFTPKKDQGRLIQALPIILGKFPNTSLILIGRGPKLDKCERLIRSLSLSPYIDIISDTNHPEPYIAASQICVLISPHGEGLSNVIIEYMALAKPVVATNLGGNRELVEDSKTGYLIKENSSLIIAECVIKLLRNPERARQMGVLGKEKIFSQFGLGRMIDEYEGLYCRLLK